MYPMSSADKSQFPSVVRMAKSMVSKYEFDMYQVFLVYD